MYKMLQDLISAGITGFSTYDNNKILLMTHRIPVAIVGKDNLISVDPNVSVTAYKAIEDALASEGWVVTVNDKPLYANITRADSSVDLFDTRKF
jgi:hypothetical protein